MFRKSLLLASVVCLGLAAVALGQTGPIGSQTGPGSGPTGPTGQAPAVNPQPAPAGQGLSDQVLLDYLRSLDANVKVQKHQHGTYYTLTLKKGTMSIPATFDVNNGYIWMLVTVANPIPDPSLVPATILAEMLKIHTPIGPTFFTFQKVGNGYRLELRHRVDRSSLKRLQDAIAEFTGDVQNSQSVWTAFQQSMNAGGNQKQ